MRARQFSTLFQPPSPATYSKVDQCIRFEQIVDSKTQTHNVPLIWIYTSTGSRLPAALFRTKGAELTVLVSQSNDEDLGISCTYAKRLCEHCSVNVMCYEYSGYGISTGKPSEKNFYADIQAAYNYLIGEEDLIPEQIVLLGRSVGSGPACELATNFAVRGLILVSPILSVLRLEKSITGSGMRLLGANDLFENIAKISNIGCPILLVHGKNDKRVPLTQAIELWQKTRNPITPLYTDAGHDNAESVDYEMIFQKYREFFKSLDCPVMDALPPRKKSGKSKSLEPGSLMKSRVNDLMESSGSSRLESVTSVDRISSRRESKRKRASFFTTRKSFAALQQAASIEVISENSSPSATNQPPTRRFRSLGLPDPKEGDDSKTT